MLVEPCVAFAGLLCPFLHLNLLDLVGLAPAGLVAFSDFGGLMTAGHVAFGDCGFAPAGSVAFGE